MLMMVGFKSHSRRNGYILTMTMRWWTLLELWLCKCVKEQWSRGSKYSSFPLLFCDGIFRLFEERNEVNRCNKHGSFGCCSTSIHFYAHLSFSIETSAWPIFFIYLSSAFHLLTTFSIPDCCTKKSASPCVYILCIRFTFFAMQRFMLLAFMPFFSNLTAVMAQTSDTLKSNMEIRKMDKSWLTGLYLRFIHSRLCDLSLSLHSTITTIEWVVK